jgi:hypothetical protein
MKAHFNTESSTQQWSRRFTVICTHRAVKSPFTSAFEPIKRRLLLLMGPYQGAVANNISSASIQTKYGFL